MALPPLEEIPGSVVTRASEVELLVLDCDGVLTDGRLWYGAQGEMMKAFDTRDGHGLVMLRHVGIRFAALSGRPQPLLRQRFEELGFAKVLERQYLKGEAIEALCEELDVDRARTAFMGDDVNDLPAMERVGLSACPQDAAAEVIEAAHYVCGRPGGRGAVRELCELLLKARGRWPVP
ncbi:MAG: HAD family hydrolase [Deltaproteobacteria bacterium]|nr:MAG: HAD family hydrolase [Deltaproteobacteria bacterium]